MKKILEMIEAVDPEDTAKLNEIECRAWCWLNKYKYLGYAIFKPHYLKALEEKGNGYCYGGSHIYEATGWAVHCQQHHASNYSNHVFLHTGADYHPRQDAEGYICSPKYTRSRDALKSIRPEGWLPFCGNRHKLNGDKPFYFGFIHPKQKIGSQVISEDLPTEELAELHAIIQAINYERLNP